MRLQRKSRAWGRSRIGRAISVLLIMGLLVACGGPAAPTPRGEGQEAEPAAQQEAASVEVGDEMESPMLAQRVAAGELPALDERLPAEPLVVEPVESLGKYGGTWRMALVGGQDNAWLTRTISYDHLVRWARDWSGVEPNVALAFEANEDGSEYTFRLREGMKWSDGEPFMADDIVFWWNDVATNIDLSPGGPQSWMRVGDEQAVVEKVDDYTVVFRFPVPNGLLLQNLATPDGDHPTRYPMHYCSEFHQDHNAEGIDELVQAAGVADWVELFRLKCAGVPGTPYDARWQNGDLPTLKPWKLTVPYGAGSQVVAERNPYYWKVDTAGRQLPYIDRVVYDVLEDREVLLLKVLNGEIDMMSRHFNTNDNKAVLTDNMDAGGYQFFNTQGTGGTIGFHFNLTHKDPRLREIFQNKDFRVALSHAINRQEIIDLFYIGQGEVMNNAMDRNSGELFDEEMFKLYTEFDPDLASEHLAAAGITEKGPDGFYLGPDGQSLTFVVQTTEAFAHSTVAEIVVQQWRDFGINAQLNVMDRALLYTRKDSNEHDVHVWGAGGGPEVFLDPRHFLPVTSESAYAMAWYTWFVNPTGTGALVQPEEPPDPVKRQMELYNQIKATGDQAEQVRLMKELLEIAKDQFYVIGVSSSPPGYGIVKNTFHNVPQLMPGSWQYPDPAPTNPEQYWIE
jgi:peptide/nickel transport system substrate-binding protein